VRAPAISALPAAPRHRHFGHFAFCWRSILWNAADMFGLFFAAMDVGAWWAASAYVVYARIRTHSGLLALGAGRLTVLLRPNAFYKQPRYIDANVVDVVAVASHFDNGHSYLPFHACYGLFASLPFAPST